MHNYIFMCNSKYEGYFCLGQEVLVEGTVYPPRQTALIFLALGGTVLSSPIPGSHRVDRSAGSTSRATAAAAQWHRS